MATDLVVILSSDWVDSTATRTRLGEEPADTLQELHDSLIRKVIAADAGEVIKHSGDGVLATFRSATSALAAAVNIQKEFARYTASPGAIAPIRVRVGLAAGDVKPMSGDIFGRPVVEAVRLQSLAAPDGILCSELVRVLTYGRGGFEFEDLGLRELKGLAPVQAHRVTRPAPSPAESRETVAPAELPRLRADDEAADGLRRRAEPPDASVAVLPFVNMSSDPDQEYFSDGLSEELTNQLAQIKALRVAGRTSSFAFKSKAADFGEIGEKLGVRYVLEGSVRKVGKKLRITAQLIDCSDGFHVWSERFDRDLDDVFAIQDEIAHAVADKLSVTFGVGPTRPGSTQSAEAYDLMLRARALVRRRRPGDPDRAVVLLRQALAIDPRFALAWNVIGNALTSLLTFGPKDPEGVRKQIDDALVQSVVLAPDLWTGHEAKANQLELRHDWVDAEQANARARALAPPSMREPVISRCNQLAIVGRIREAIPFALEAARIEPLVSNALLPQLLFYCGMNVEAEAAAERNREVSGAPFLDDLFACGRAMARGDHANAKRYLEACVAADAELGSIRREVLEVFDDADRARALLRSCLATASDEGSYFARMHSAAPFAAYFGEPEVAVTIFRRIHRRLLGVFIINFWHPLFREMRRAPAFKELAKEVGLVKYWRTTGQWGGFARPVGNDDFEVL
jgi:adenylate cyclase